MNNIRPAFPSADTITNEYQDLCRLSGHLFLHFGRLENILTSALKLHLAFNIAEPGNERALQLASSIYGSQRFKASRDIVKRIMAAESAPKKLITVIDGMFS